MKPLKLLFIAASFVMISLSSCDELFGDEEDSPEPSSSSKSGVCSGSYKAASKDAQLDSFCGAAYAYRCLDGKSLSNSQVQSVCNTYNSLKLSSAPDCSYCK